ncbi:unnamed protein product [Rotaria socialis]|uniref:Uncharacterized protein n=1 Tax=Rotaria socialis TaxID=392032 RepID=A0A818CNW5_9BILA|nr:unnamed protein product [Rotaria socialis]CAF3435753.1 unnamed protein product [Rotaria socialis]CAF3440053.1 unnamed protein product [Rotaria socialis]CAF3445303.1 unnamed protein product [Rotaria socialis]CAF3762947.1 unnamed protein product [Rotaria socialis]
MEYCTSRPVAKYIEVGSNGGTIFASPTVPSFIESAFIKPYYPIRSTRSINNEYRTFDRPFRLENRSRSYDYNTFSPEEFYRTSNQEYGAYPPMIHSLPPIYRPLRHTFTDMLKTGQEHHHLRNFKMSTDNLPSIWAPRGALPISIGRGSYVRHSMRPVFK